MPSKYAWRGCRIGDMLGWIRGNWSGFGAGLLIAACVLIASWFTRAPPTPVTVIVPTMSASPTASVVVHIAGAVRDPGVYVMPAGARVADALERAGGTLDGADPDAFNLAARLADGQRINVPMASETRVVVPGRVDLNRASRPELEALPGIGPATAQRILDLRERSGPIQSLDQLRELRIIPSQTVERIRDLVIVD
jgi:competence protein ComEA